MRMRCKRVYVHKLFRMHARVRVVVVAFRFARFAWYGQSSVIVNSGCEKELPHCTTYMGI